LTGAKARPLLSLADRHYVLDKGRIIWCGTSDALKALKT
jgi:ABC-type branched-subunit amino acid transport system ATPase component